MTWVNPGNSVGNPLCFICTIHIIMCVVQMKHKGLPTELPGLENLPTP